MKPKKPSKEPSLPSQNEARRANVLMEQMLSKFDTFGESLSDVRERVVRIETDVHTVKEDIGVLKSAVRTNSEDIKSIKSDVAILKSDVAEIKVDFKGYNQRLEVVEAKS